jgi:5-methylcytosine-specific restriction endonuclease McrA
MTLRRREFPAKMKVAAYQRAAGRCEVCTAPLRVGKFEYDHRIPDALGGEPTLENCIVTCSACHSAKTRTEDVPRIAKAKRQERGYVGAKPRKAVLPGSRGSKWKRKINGATVRRDQERRE